MANLHHAACKAEDQVGLFSHPDSFGSQTSCSGTFSNRSSKVGVLLQVGQQGDLRSICFKRIIEHPIGDLHHMPAVVLQQVVACACGAITKRLAVLPCPIADKVPGAVSLHRNAQLRQGHIRLQQRLAAPAVHYVPCHHSMAARQLRHRSCQCCL